MLKQVQHDRRRKIVSKLVNVYKDNKAGSEWQKKKIISELVRICENNNILSINKKYKQ